MTAMARPTATSKPTGVLHVHGRMGRGGAEMQTMEILRHIDRRRWRFHCCALSGLPGEFDDEIRALGGKVHLMRQSRVGFPRRFRQLLRRERIDVIHSHLHYYTGYLLRLGAECGTPVRVAHFRTTKTDVVPGPGRKILHGLLGLCVDRYATDRPMRRWMDRYATHILGVSQWALRSAWGPNWKADSRCQVVYDGLQPALYGQQPDRTGVRREFGLPEGCPLYVHVGRMAEPKNHVRLVSIFGEVLRRQPTARLLLVGRLAADGRGDTVQRRVRRRIAELGVGDCVLFCGERKDVPRLLKASDVLIFPSLWEGLGDVVLEACAAGTPTLASDLPAIGEIAQRLRDVRCLSLDEPDARWAESAIEMAGRRPSASAREAALESFGKSLFTVAECARRLCRIWQGARRQPQTGGAADG